MRMKMNKGKRFCTKFGFKMNNIIYAAFLTMLSEKPLYGYLLVEGLESLGIDKQFVPYGAAYRILRSMEAEGLITSHWNTEGNGPARRVYKITEAGKEFLKNWLVEAKNNFNGIEKLIKKIEENLSKNYGGEK
jgi:PadR family transcriptional regulator PadR